MQSISTPGIWTEFRPSGVSSLIWFSLSDVGSFHIRTPKQLVPVVRERCAVAQPKAGLIASRLFTLSFPSASISSVCPSSSFTDGQDTNVLLSLCLWNKLRSLEAAVPETLKPGITFDTRVEICKIISDPWLLLTPDLSRRFPYKSVES